MSQPPDLAFFQATAGVLPALAIAAAFTSGGALEMHKLAPTIEGKHAAERVTWRDVLGYIGVWAFIVATVSGEAAALRVLWHHKPTITAGHTCAGAMLNDAFLLGLYLFTKTMTELLARLQKNGVVPWVVIGFSLLGFIGVVAVFFVAAYS